METKLYIRDGKRFKYVPNMVGMYWNGIVLTKERMQDSIAIVIEQHYDHVTMASLKMSKPISWYNAKEWCKNDFDGKGRFPSKAELMILHKYANKTFIWGEENSDNYAWVLGWCSGAINGYPKYDSFYIRAVAVIDIPILNLI